ncbi:hypothetical protein [Paenibacillus sp. NRS-1781]|uniref:hypothetical protein n=1 Tax=Paenibacillus sp. NRS-1781 TaxID=3233905 RepID=UPI003D2795BF
MEYSLISGEQGHLPEVGSHRNMINLGECLSVKLGITVNWQKFMMNFYKYEKVVPIATLSLYTIAMSHEEAMDALKTVNM